jgi:endonuclease G
MGRKSNLLLLIALTVATVCTGQQLQAVDLGIYKVVYSEKLENPVKVTYVVLCPDGTASRTGMEFYTDKKIHTADNYDYVNNEWDKGHMAPAADFNCNKEMLYKTFTYLNSALQHQSLNRGIWKHLEMHERELAKKEKVEVIIDIEFDKEPKKVPGGASIPKGFYKHIRYKTGKVCYYFPNEAPKKSTYKDYQIQCDK